ncbi:MAG: hypothetical protein M0Z30_11735 [Actinomycetota bacterium]|nr:hypothetical protein [Actinomycetota bacterium]
MQQRRRLSHERGDYTTVGIAVGAVFGAAGGLVLGDASLAMGAAVGAGAGLVIGAVLDAWADHPHSNGGRDRHSSAVS